MQKLLAIPLGYTSKLCVLPLRMYLYTLSWPFIVCGVCVLQNMTVVSVHTCGVLM